MILADHAKKIIRSLCFGCALLTTVFNDSSHATVTIIGAQGASRFNLNNNTTETGATTTPTIYGGMAGSCTGNGTATCDSCRDLGATLGACNPSRIYPSLKLVISFTSTTAGTAVIATSEATDTIANSLFEGSQVVANGNGQVTILWQNLCNQLNSNSSCVNSFSANLKVGVSTDGGGTIADFARVTITVNNFNNGTVGTCTDADNGICDFVIFPGDGKVYVESPEQGTNFPTIESSQFQRVAVMYSSSGFSSVGPGVGNLAFVDITEDQDGLFFSSDTVEGLENGTTYFFRVGSVDLAGNLGFITSDASIAEKCGKSAASLTADDDADCDYIATPDEVFGLLEGTDSCFVATAAYGSTFHPEVHFLREFRRRFLLTSGWGRELNSLYNHFGPRLADWIRSSPHRRSVARTAIQPFAQMAKWAIQGPTHKFWWATFGSSILVIIVLALAVAGRTRRLRQVKP